MTFKLQNRSMQVFFQGKKSLRLLSIWSVWWQTNKATKLRMCGPFSTPKAEDKLNVWAGFHQQNSKRNCLWLQISCKTQQPQQSILHFSDLFLIVIRNIIKNTSRKRFFSCSLCLSFTVTDPGGREGEREKRGEGERGVREKKRRLVLIWGLWARSLGTWRSLARMIEISWVEM